jgi:electron transport complex protein RnfE
MSNSVNYREIIEKSLWSNNGALVQMLGLCPLLAVSSTVVNALGLGLATLLVLTLTNITVSFIRNIVNDTIRLPTFVMIIAATVSCVEMLMQAFTYELYQILGLFIPLIVTNCVVLGRADAFASKNTFAPALVDGFMTGLGFLLVLVAVGAVREVLGTGHIFADMQLLFGEVARTWQLNLFGESYPNVIFALLPPGAFIVVGLLIAVKNWIDERRKQALRARTILDTAPKASKRVRTTGHIN